MKDCGVKKNPLHLLSARKKVSAYSTGKSVAKYNQQAIGNPQFPASQSFLLPVEALADENKCILYACPPVKPIMTAIPYPVFMNDAPVP
jgi:hypothetical protein